MNARYNGYFYSNESFKESVRKVEKANKDDFTQLLPVFIYPDNASAKGFKSDFEKVIKKSSVVIHRHAIINPRTKEEIPNACKWIDENYMLIGKSHLYERDFFSALEVFEYVAKKYKNPEAKYSGMLWMMRTDNEIGSFSKSEPIIDDLRNAKDFPKDKDYQRELATTVADFYMKTENYSAAIDQLEKAVEITKKKSVKARYLFILAQLYEKQGENGKASSYYNRVAGLHPYYEMEFTAKINSAKLFDVNKGDSRIVKKQLIRMAHDDKNAEFRDQIYYVLAGIVYRENDVPQALTYLDKSIRTSVTNKTQKALSFLKRGDIYFEKRNYRPAEQNYDSAFAFLPKDYHDYSILEAKKKSLNALITNLKTIELEDSLQRLAKMSDKDRSAAIDGMIAKVAEDEKKKEEERLDKLNNPQPLIQNQNTSTTNTSTQTQSTGAWYFYNPATVSFGATEFVKKWGSRKLEDNWRRSEKEQEIATVNPEDVPAVDSLENKKNTVASTNKDKKDSKKDKDFYLKKLPLTPDELNKSDEKIVDAYYNIGGIYKEQLLDNAKSAETFEELLKRYPDNKYKVASYYQLYRAYLAMNNTTKADYYRNILVTNYPDSEYAKIIKNPSYAKDVMASKSLVEKFYAETFQLYSEEKYSAALSNCQMADTMYAKSDLMPRFSFIKALCIGRTQDINAFESALTQVIIKYPKAPVKDKAQEMLDLIRKQKNPVTVATEVKSDTTKGVTKDLTKDVVKDVTKDTAQTKSKFIFKEDGDYFWITTIVNGKGDINKFKSKLSDYNEDSFSAENLTISSVFLDLTHQLVSVKNFAGKAKAMEYYNFFKDLKGAFSDLEPNSYQTFIISAENYAIFYKDKNITDYQQFFTQNFK